MIMKLKKILLKYVGNKLCKFLIFLNVVFICNTRVSVQINALHISSIFITECSLLHKRIALASFCFTFPVFFLEHSLQCPILAVPWRGSIALDCCVTGLASSPNNNYFIAVLLFAGIPFSFCILCFTWGFISSCRRSNKFFSCCVQEPSSQDFLSSK